MAVRGEDALRRSESGEHAEAVPEQGRHRQWNGFGDPIEYDPHEEHGEQDMGVRRREG